MAGGKASAQIMKFYRAVDEGTRSTKLNYLVTLTPADCDTRTSMRAPIKRILHLYYLAIGQFNPCFLPEKKAQSNILKPDTVSSSRHLVEF